MIKALAIKELREVLGIAFLGLGAELILVAGVTGLQPFARLLEPILPRETLVPFIDSNFLKCCSIIAVALALALGFRQSAWENGRGTYQFLLHRPLRRETIFLTKLGVGLAVILICTGLPIILYALWAAVPGTHPSPFEWSMTSRSWQAWLAAPVLYGGAFLSGLRPARWLGTRLLPLIGAVVAASVMLIYPWPWLLGLPLLLLIYAVFATNICYVARMREYS